MTTFEQIFEVAEFPKLNRRIQIPQTIKRIFKAFEHEVVENFLRQAENHDKAVELISENMDVHQVTKDLHDEHNLFDLLPELVDEAHTFYIYNGGQKPYK